MLVPVELEPPETAVSTTVHEKTEPETLLVKTIGTTAPAQIVWFKGVAVITGIGSTVMVTVIGLPGQLLAVGVTVYTAVPCVEPVVNVSAIVVPELFVPPVTPPF